MRRDDIDFHAVRAIHAEIHARLQNWARWSRGSRGGGNVQPMFQGYRPDGYYEIAGGGIPIDSLDATKVQKLFCQLPEKHRWAIQWSYVYPFIPERKVCRYLAVTRIALGDLVHDGRSMLKNTSCNPVRSSVGSRQP